MLYKLLYNKLCSLLIRDVLCYIYFCHDNSRRDWHGNEHDNVNVFGLGGIDLLHYAAAATTVAE